MTSSIFASITALACVRSPVYYFFQAPVVQTNDSAIRRINYYPLDNSIGFASVYPLDSDLSGW